MSERSQCFRTPLPLGCSHLQHPGVSTHYTRVIEVSSLQCLKHIYPGISALRKLGHRAPKPIPQKLLSTFANLDSNFYIRVKLLGYSAVWLLLWGLSPKVFSAFIMRETPFRRLGARSARKFALAHHKGDLIQFSHLAKRQKSPKRGYSSGSGK